MLHDLLRILRFSHIFIRVMMHCICYMFIYYMRFAHIDTIFLIFVKYFELERSVSAHIFVSP